MRNSGALSTVGYGPFDLPLTLELSSLPLRCLGAIAHLMLPLQGGLEE